MSIKAGASAHVATSIGDDAVDTDAIEDDAVTYPKMQNVSADERILGRVSGANGVIEELTKTQVLTFANVENGADVTDTTNVTAAGALMDSELAGIAAVKATTGTFLSADESKLDGIEASATADQTDITINAAPGDDTASGIKASFTAGEALSRGEVVYFKAGDSRMWKAVATATGTMPVVAMAAADIGSGSAGLFLLQGFIRDDGTFPAYTVGGRLYAPEAETSSENVPEQTAPDSDGDFVQDIGFAVTANILYFNPSPDVIEHA